MFDILVNILKSIGMKVCIHKWNKIRIPYRLKCIKCGKEMYVGP